MAKTYRYLVSYIAANQPCSREIESEQAGLTPQQAEAILHELQDANDPGAITDVQVTGLYDAKHGGSEPGHYQQP